MSKHIIEPVSKADRSEDYIYIIYIYIYIYNISATVPPAQAGVWFPLGPLDF